MCILSKGILMCGKDHKDKEQLIWSNGFRRTKQREEVCRILMEADMPLSAVQIYKKMRGYSQEEGHALSTVYRIMAAMEERSLVTKTFLIGGDVAYYQWNHGEHEHYAICLNCHRRIPISKCPFEQNLIRLDEDGFRITGHKIEIFGYCKTCSEERRSLDE